MFFKKKIFFIFLSFLLLNEVFSATLVSTEPSSEDDDLDKDDLDDSDEIEDDGKIYKNPRNSPSAACPRDEEQATLLGQKCLRKCSSDEDCKSKKKKCLCDGACGMSCIKPDRECPELPDPEYGRVSVTGKLFGDRATYTCTHGYHVVGLQSRTCQADGQWAGQAPSCKQNIYCLSPPNIDHARHNALPEQATFDLDSTLQYYCHTGYVTNGFPRAKCLAIDGQASWYGPDISCEPRSCGPPPDLAHGWHAGECYTYGCRVMYHCAEGFELVGKSERFCQADGTWSPKDMPTCVLVTAVQCPPPENPRNGKAIYTSCSYNSVVSYECKYGYTLVGESTRKCGADRKWTGTAPQCKVYCPFPGYVENGKVLLVGNMGLYDYRPYVRKIVNNKQIMYECEKGYVLLEGPPGATCIGGHWSPKDLPRCVLGQHPRLRWSRRRRSIALQQYRRALLGQKAANLYIRMKRSLERKEHHQRKHLRQHSHENSNRRLRTHFDDWYYFQRGKRAPKLKMGASTSVRQRNNLKSIRRKDGTGRGRKKSSGAGDADEDDVDDELGELPPERPKKHTPCEVLSSEPYVNIEFVKQGKDPNVTYSQGTVVRVACGKGYVLNMESNNTAKCVKGRWKPMKPECLIPKPLTDADELLAHQLANNNNTCIFRNQEPNVVSFYNDQQIREDIVEFPNGAELVSRCVDIGKYAMIGSNRRKCVGGEWDGQKPSCFGLNQENDYAMEKPPTVLFRHQLGPIAQSNDGKLIVYPGTILHMECLWIRRFGNPKWNVSHDYRKYPEGWTQDPGRDPQLEYRLSIYHAARDDSGIFTCITPARHSHSVEIEVKAVHCPAITNRRGLTVSSQSTKMNTKLTFSCANGNSLIGATEIICLPSGNWSAPFPICESIECGDVISGEGDVGGPSGLGPHLRVAIVSREVGGRAVFSCSPGFGLRGPHETVCTSSGEWAQPFPTCSEVQCETPGEPENGYIQGSGPYKAGDVVQFNCNPDFMMEGQPIIACQDNSRWSGPLPKCVQACSYPGTTISGRMSSVKFYYKIGENITFTCDDGLILRGASMLKCLRNGKWSNAIPTCVSPDSER